MRRAPGIITIVRNPVGRGLLHFVGSVEANNALWCKTGYRIHILFAIAFLTLGSGWFSSFCQGSLDYGVPGTQNSKVRVYNLCNAHGNPKRRLVFGLS